MSEQLLTLQEFASAIRCTLAAARKWAREGRIETVKISRLVRVPKTEVERLIAEGTRAAVLRQTKSDGKSQ